MFKTRVLLGYLFQLLLQVLHLLILLKQLFGQFAKHLPFIVSHPFSLIIYELLTFFKFFVALFKVQESVLQPSNLFFFFFLLAPKIFVLAYSGEELFVFFQIAELILSLNMLVVFVVNLLSQWFDRFLVVGCHLLVFFEVLLLSFAFVAVANEPLVVFVNHFYHGVLLIDELLLLFIKLLGFLNNFLFLGCETVVNLSFFPLLLKESYSLQRSLALNNESPDFVKFIITNLGVCWLLNVFVNS